LKSELNQKCCSAAHSRYLVSSNMPA